MKNFVKNLLKKTNKNAYTVLDYYTPKKPQALKK